MKKVLQIAKRYRFFLLFFAANLLLLCFVPEIGKTSFAKTWDNIKEMLMVIPPIFLLLGLLDVWVERETMVKFMGEKSGLKGAVIALVLGSAAAGPLYAAFPLAGTFLKKGATLFNVFLFIGAWATTKIPMILFETTNLGLEFMLIRLGLNLAGIILIAYILEKTTPEQERENIYEIAEKL